MSDELFAVEESLSPKLRWMREMWVHTLHVPEADLWLAGTDEIAIQDDWLWCGSESWGPVADLSDDEADGGDMIIDWCAPYDDDDIDEDLPSMFAGKTEDEAIAALAKDKGWRLWNELEGGAS